MKSNGGRGIRYPRVAAVVAVLWALLAGSPAAEGELSRHAAFGLKGSELARLQIERGLRKPIKARAPQDQSLESLRGLIGQETDRRLRAVLPAVEELERLLAGRNGDGERTYTDDLIEDLKPIALHIQRHTGIPASVLLTQIVVESGWGGSNVTILKNNVLGLGVAQEVSEFEVELVLGGERRSIRVRTYDQTRAYGFDSIGDGILYYVYVLLQSSSNERHYGTLRRFLEEQRGARIDDAYRRRVLRLIAGNYHADPKDYVAYLAPLVDRYKWIDGEGEILLASNRAGAAPGVPGGADGGKGGAP